MLKSQVGENYYLPMTTYLETKSAVPLPLTMASLEKEIRDALNQESGPVGFELTGKFPPTPTVF